MKTRDEQIRNRILRRFRSPRASVYFEFALIAPLAMSLIMFSLDFSRLLKAEQQIEICSRAMADVQSHYDNYGEGTHDIPSTRTKTIVKKYLKESLGLEINNILCKGTAAPIPGVSGVITPIKEFLEGKTKVQQDSVVLRFLGQFLGGAIDVLTFHTQTYLLEGVSRDRYVKMSMAVKMPMFMPRRVYDFMAVDGGGGWAEVVQWQYPLEGGASWSTRKPKLTERQRYYCVMPMMDTWPTAPATYTRRMRGWFGKWVPESVWTALE